MGRRHYYLVIIFVVCAFYRCTPTPPKFEEMIGTWKAKDGATIELKADSTFIIKNFDSYFLQALSNDTIRYKVNIIGKWEVEDVYLGNMILYIGIDYAIMNSDSFLMLDESKWIIRNYSTPFYIKGDGGILTDKAPWFIRAIDDFDNYRIYDFRRVE